MDEQMPETQPGNLPDKPYGTFAAMAQGATDYTVQALNINGMLTLMASEEAVYVTKQQAMAFYGLIDPAALSQPAAQVDSVQGVMLDALKTTAGNIRSLGPAGALFEPYKVWLEVVDSAITKAQVDSCRVDQFSSRICEKGTKSCTVVHPAGGECGGVQVPSITVSALDELFAKEIVVVSNVAYNSNSICRWFYKNLRDAIVAKATP